jgi:replicative DNA helicase
VKYLASLVAHAAPAIALCSHVELLQDLAARRAAVAAANDLAASAQSVTLGETFRPVLAAHVEAMQALFDRGSGRKTTYTAAEAGTVMVDRIARIRSGEVDRNAIKTGIAALDRCTGGLHRGEYVILGGRPSMGKTALAVQLTYNVAERGGGVFYASLEMPVALMSPRLASCHLWTPGGATDIAYTRILRGDLGEMEARWVASAAQEMKPFPLIIDDAPGLSPAELEARAQVAKSKLERNGRSLDLVVVDHLHKMRQPGTSSKVSEYTEISARLAEMAKRLDCPVVALAQLNRGVENRDDKRPQLADLRESGSIEQDADVVLFVYRPAYYLERKRCTDPAQEADRLADLAAVASKLEVIIEKQRSGPIGTIDLWCDMASNVVRDSEAASTYLEHAA